MVATALVAATSIAAAPLPATAALPGAGSAPASTGPVWEPAPATTWQWQIVGRIGGLEDVDMYDIDLTDAVPRRIGTRVPGFGRVTWAPGSNAGIVERLHAAGIVAVCYLDSGAWESYEPDAALFPRSVIGNPTGWSGERWLDIRPRSRSRFAPIIWARFALARRIGCDGVEPDQNNPIGNRPGFPISREAERSWYLSIARHAHAEGLSVGMKNGVEVIDRATVSAFDWSLNEECFYYRECGREMPFIEAGKAVFQAEYTDDWRRRGGAAPGQVADRVCGRAARRGLSTLIKRRVPDALFRPC
ncbi:MAG: endo alpha-1,4 polygalactosaminidase [Solirubrobacterales bacterium]